MSWLMKYTRAKRSEATYSKLIFAIGAAILAAVFLLVIVNVGPRAFAVGLLPPSQGPVGQLAPTPTPTPTNTPIPPTATPTSSSSSSWRPPGLAFPAPEAVDFVIVLELKMESP